MWYRRASRRKSGRPDLNHEFLKWLASGFPPGLPILPPLLIRDLGVLTLWPKIGWVAGRNASATATMLAKMTDGRIVLSDPDAKTAEIGPSYAGSIGPSIGDSRLPPSAADFVVGLDIGTFADRDKFLTEAARVARPNALVALVERGALKINPLHLAGVDKCWRETIDPNGFKPVPPDLDWIRGLSDWDNLYPPGATDLAVAFGVDLNDEAFVIEGNLAADQLANCMLDAGGKDVDPSLRSALVQRLQWHLADAFPDRSGFGVSWPLIARRRRPPEQRTSS